MLKNKTVSRLFLAIFCCFVFVNLGHTESCPSAGQVQYKPEGSCETSERVCCASTGEWSDWGGSCPSCSSDQCWNGSICEEAPSDKGKTVTEDCAVFGISYTCNSGSGWERKKTYIHSSSSKTSCWDGSSCVAKPSECGQANGDCKVYTTACSCSASSGWTVSKELIGCPSGLVPRDGRCVHPGGASFYVAGEQHGSGPCNADCPFGISSMRQCGTILYAIYSSGVAGCTICDFPYKGYYARMNKVSSI